MRLRTSHGSQIMPTELLRHLGTTKREYTWHKVWIKWPLRWFSYKIGRRLVKEVESMYKEVNLPLTKWSLQSFEYRFGAKFFLLTAAIHLVRCLILFLLEKQKNFSQRALVALCILQHSKISPSWIVWCIKWQIEIILKFFMYHNSYKRLAS